MEGDPRAGFEMLFQIAPHRAAIGIVGKVLALEHLLGAGPPPVEVGKDQQAREKDGGDPTAGGPLEGRGSDRAEDEGCGQHLQEMPRVRMIFGYGDAQQR